MCAVPQLHGGEARARPFSQLPLTDNPLRAFFFCDFGLTRWKGLAATLNTVDYPLSSLGSRIHAPSSGLCCGTFVCTCSWQHVVSPSSGPPPSPSSHGSGPRSWGPLAGAECWQGCSPAGHRAGHAIESASAPRVGTAQQASQTLGKGAGQLSHSGPFCPPTHCVLAAPADPWFPC